jgi:hypothetical protein
LQGNRHLGSGSAVDSDRVADRRTDRRANL